MSMMTMMAIMMMMMMMVMVTIMMMILMMVAMMVMVVTFNGQLKLGGLSLAKAATDQDHLGPCPDHHHVVDPEYLRHVVVV